MSARLDNFVVGRRVRHASGGLGKGLMGTVTANDGKFASVRFDDGRRGMFAELSLEILASRGVTLTPA